MACDPCPPGHGVVHNCSMTSITECSPCDKGFYSKHVDEPCYHCSECGIGLFELHSCNGTHDVFCEKCELGRYATIGNINYDENCINYIRHNTKNGGLKSFLRMGDQPLQLEQSTQTSLTDVAVEDPDEINDTFVKSTSLIQNMTPITTYDQTTELGVALMSLSYNEDSTVRSTHKGLPLQSETHKSEEKSTPEARSMSLLDEQSGIQHDIGATTIYDINTTDLTEDDDASNTQTVELNILATPITPTYMDETTLGSISASDVPEARTKILTSLTPAEGLGPTGLELQNYSTNSPSKLHLTARNNDELTSDQTSNTGGPPLPKLRTAKSTKTTTHAQQDQETRNNIFVAINDDSSQTTSSYNDSIFIAGLDEVHITEIEKPGTPVFGIVIAALTSGLIFFAIGFWFTKCKRKKAVYTPSRMHAVNSTEKPIYRGPPKPARLDNNIVTPSKFEMLRNKQKQRRSSYEQINMSLVKRDNTHNEVDDAEKAKLVDNTIEGEHAQDEYEEEKKPIDDSDGSDDEADGVVEEDQSNRTNAKPLAKDQHEDGRPEEESPLILPKQDMDLSHHLPTVFPTTTQDHSHNQSPVNIDADNAVVDAMLEKVALTFFYVPSNTRSITNTGDTVRVNVDGRGSLLVGGPVGDKRNCLHHIDFHWGSVDERGSEHTVNSKRYSGEIQLVHWNRDDYSSYEDACVGDAGLSIMSILIQIGEDYHDGFGILSRSLATVRYKGETRDFMADFDPALLLPDNSFDYWTYSGSITSPPYTENVQWIVFKCPIEISRDQVQALRRLRSYNRGQSHGGLGVRQTSLIIDNFRPIFPLEGRVVRASFI